MDMLSELAPNQTPYRYGFNNPVYWQDKTGLFESRGAAQEWVDTWGLTGANIYYNPHKGVYQIENNGVSFYQLGEDIISHMYSMDTGELLYTITRGAAASGGGSDDSPGFKLLGFSPSEIGVLANGAGVYAGTLETYAKNTARMERIAKISGRFSTGLSIYSTASSGYKVYNQYQTGRVENIDGWDLADTTVGVVGLGGSVLVTLGIVSNPVGWVIGAGVLIYGGVRFIQDMNGYH